MYARPVHLWSAWAKHAVLMRMPSYALAWRATHFSVVFLDSVDEYEQTISEGTRCTLLMYDPRSSSGGSHGVHHMLLFLSAMHALRQARLQRTSGPLWS